MGDRLDVDFACIARRWGVDITSFFSSLAEV